MRELTLPGGGVLEYVEYGDPGGRPVVLQPGTPGTATTGALLEAAARRCGVRLVSVSRPGYGASAAVPPGLSVVARQVECLADYLSLERFGLWGLSGGGPFALAQAALTPERVTRVVVAAGPAPEEAGDDAPALTSEAAVMKERFARLDPETFADGLSPQDYFRVHPEGVPDFLAELRRGLDRPDGYVRDNLSWRDPWDIDLAEIACPVDLVYAEFDKLTTLDEGERLAAAIPHANLHVIPGGHGDAAFGAADLALAILAGW